MYRDRLGKANDCPMPRQGALSVFEAYAKKGAKLRNPGKELSGSSTNGGSWETEEVEVVRSSTECAENVTPSEILGPLVDDFAKERGLEDDTLPLDGRTGKVGPFNSTLLPGALPVVALDPPRLPSRSHVTPPEPPDVPPRFQLEHSGSPSPPDFERTLVAVPSVEDPDASSRYDGKKKSRSRVERTRSRMSTDAASKESRHSNAEHSTSRDLTLQSSGRKHRSVKERTSDKEGSRSSAPTNVGKSSEHEAPASESGGEGPGWGQRVEHSTLRDQRSQSSGRKHRSARGQTSDKEDSRSSAPRDVGNESERETSASESSGEGPGRGQRVEHSTSRDQRPQSSGHKHRSVRGQTSDKEGSRSSAPRDIGNKSKRETSASESGGKDSGRDQRVEQSTSQDLTLQSSGRKHRSVKERTSDKEGSRSSAPGDIGKSSEHEAPASESGGEGSERDQRVEHSTSRDLTLQSSGRKHRSVEERTSDEEGSRSSAPRDVGNESERETSASESGGEGPGRGQRAARSKKVANRSTDGETNRGRRLTFSNSGHRVPTGGDPAARSPSRPHAEGPRTSNVTRGDSKRRKRGAKDESTRSPVDGPVARSPTSRLRIGRQEPKHILRSHFREEAGRVTCPPLEEPIASRKADEEKESESKGPRSRSAVGKTDKPPCCNTAASATLKNLPPASMKPQSPPGNSGTGRPDEVASKGRRSRQAKGGSTAPSTKRKHPTERDGTNGPDGGFEWPEHIPQDILEVILEEYQKRASK